ncbi:tetratricopeptide repeat protein [Puteibacter caeruleilacunae]|nr:tetratricopeptide repeat protein [Puteibacter caeruleilacunae]
MRHLKIDKILFFLLLALSLVVLYTYSIDAGISGDEKVHHLQAEKVVDYYQSFGKDRTALNTPKTNLKYYGQSFDNLAALTARIFDIDDVYDLRHRMNSIAGWLIIVFTALIAIEISGTTGGIVAIIFLLASPRFIGHSFNNLKDIPFALGYIAFIYFMIQFLKNPLKAGNKTITGLILAIAFTIGIRPGGFILLCYLVLFITIWWILQYRKKQITKGESINLIVKITATVILGYLIGLLFWPYALENPFINPIKSLQIMSDYPVRIRQLFSGNIYWSDQLPWSYIPHYMLITIPVFIIISSISYIVTSSFFSIKKTPLLAQNFILFTIAFPLLFLFIKGSNVYGGWRHFIFIYPPIIVFGASSIGLLLKQLKNIFAKTIIVFITIGGLIAPFSFIVRNHPLEYTYFNKLSGGIEHANGQFETDYYYHSVRQATDWLRNEIEQYQDKTKITSNFWIDWYFRGDPHIETYYTNYYTRGNQDWDYAIFCNAYTNPYQLQNKLWPPANTIHTIDVDGVPVCAIVKRISNDDFNGYELIRSEHYEQAISYLQNALKTNPGNEAACINLAKAYINTGRLEKARVAINQCLHVLPEYEIALMLLADLEEKLNNSDKAIIALERILKANPYYLKAYVKLASVHVRNESYQVALQYLDKCLSISKNYSAAKELKIRINEDFSTFED